MVKTCSKCGESKSLDCFPPRSGGRLRGECRLCRDTYNREYHARNRAKANARAQTRYIANREEHNRRTTAWAAAHPEAGRERVNRRRARRIAATVEPFTRDDLLSYWAERGFSGCVYCPGGEFEHTDHVVPLARGGTHTLPNLVPACARCNQSKGSKLLEEWLPAHEARLYAASA